MGRRPNQAAVGTAGVCVSLLLAACSVTLGSADNTPELIAEEIATQEPAVEVVATTAPDAEEAATAEPLPPAPVAYLDCDFSEHAPQALEAVWQVTTPNGIGTAFHVGEGRWLTAEHVIRGRSSVTLTNSGQSITATVATSDRTADMAILTSNSAPRSLPFGALDEVGPGNHAYAMGYPFYTADTAAVSRGIISRVGEYPNLGTVIQTDASVNPGNSGGPLLNECGQVIGMTIGIASEPGAEGINYSVPETILRPYLAGAPAPTPTPTNPTPTTTTPPTNPTPTTTPPTNPTPTTTTRATTTALSRDVRLGVWERNGRVSYLFFAGDLINRVLFGFTVDCDDPPTPPHFLLVWWGDDLPLLGVGAQVDFDGDIPSQQAHVFLTRTDRAGVMYEVTDQLVERIEKLEAGASGRIRHTAGVTPFSFTEWMTEIDPTPAC